MSAIALVSIGYLKKALPSRIIHPDRPGSVPPTRRNRSETLWTFAFIATVITTNPIARYVDMPTWIRGIIAVSPMIPGAMILQALQRGPLELDEFATHIWRASATFAFFATVGLITGVLLLEQGGVVLHFQWDTAGILALMFAMFFAGTAITSRRLS